MDLTNTEKVDPIIADKDPLPPMPRLLLTTADHKLQIWDLKTEGNHFPQILNPKPYFVFAWAPKGLDAMQIWDLNTTGIDFVLFGPT